jgi:hypothetical protein
VGTRVLTAGEWVEGWGAMSGRAGRRRYRRAALQGHWRAAHNLRTAFAWRLSAEDVALNELVQWAAARGRDAGAGADADADAEAPTADRAALGPATEAAAAEEPLRWDEIKMLWKCAVRGEALAQYVPSRPIPASVSYGERSTHARRRRATGGYVWCTLHAVVLALPHLHRDWAHPCHICTGTGLAPVTSAPGLGSPVPHLRRD